MQRSDRLDRLEQNWKHYCIHRCINPDTNYTDTYKEYCIWVKGYAAGIGSCQGYNKKSLCVSYLIILTGIILGVTIWLI